MSKSIWLPPGFELPVGYALQALERGDATPQQQQMALKYIVNHLSMIDSDPFNAGDQATQNRDLGRQFVGRAIKHIIFINLSKVADMMDKKKDR